MDVEEQEEQEEQEKLMLAPEDEEALRKALPRLGTPGLRPMLAMLIPDHAGNIDALVRRMEQMAREQEAYAMEQSKADAVRLEADQDQQARRESIRTFEEERAKQALEQAKEAEEREMELKRLGNAAGKRKADGQASSSLPRGKAARPLPLPRGGQGGASSSTDIRFSVSAGFGPRFQTTLRRRLNAAMRRPIQ